MNYQLIEKDDDDVMKKTSTRRRPYPAIPPRGIDLHIPRITSGQPLTTTAAAAAIALHLQSSHHPLLHSTSLLLCSKITHEQEPFLSLPQASKYQMIPAFIAAPNPPPTNNAYTSQEKAQLSYASVRSAPRNIFPGAVAVRPRRQRLPTWHAVWDLEGVAGREEQRRQQLPDSLCCRG
jgi:hypothetical protein